MDSVMNVKDQHQVSTVPQNRHFVRIAVQGVLPNPQQSGEFVARLVARLRPTSNFIAAPSVADDVDAVAVVEGVAVESFPTVRVMRYAQIVAEVDRVVPAAIDDNGCRSARHRGARYRWRRCVNEERIRGEVVDQLSVTTTLTGSRSVPDGRSIRRRGPIARRARRCDRVRRWGSLRSGFAMR